MRTLAALPRPRDVLGAFGIYVHVPFCAHRCHYCDFNAYAGLDHLAPTYMDALARDAAAGLSAPDGLLDDRPEVTSIFIGGGTPSLVDAWAIVGVLDAIRSAWTLSADCEVTVECNPESTDAATLETYLRGGVNRISFGVQSLDPELLRWLGRLHDAPTALAAISLARSVGFERVNGDLIFGVPGETDDVWRASIEGLLEAGVTHMSCYGLTYEEGTPLHEWRKLGRVTPVGDDDAARRWEMADEILTIAGLERYEISNWGEPCRHNELYWACGEYLGIGAGAHSHLADATASVRSWTLKSPERYARAIEGASAPVAGSERLAASDRAAEVMFLGLRRTAGVAADDFAALTGADLGDVYAAELERWAANGLLQWDGSSARLTTRGALLANEVLASFLS